MKKINLLLVFLTSLLILSTSCETDGGDSVIDLENGALPNFTLLEESDEFFGLNNFDSTVLIFNVDIAYGNPVSFDLMAFYQTVDGNLYGPVTIESNVTTFPTSYSLTGAEIRGLFSQLNDPSTIQIGDIVKLYANFTLPDGRRIETYNSIAEPTYFTPNFNQIPGFVYTLDFVVSCPPQPGVYVVEMHDSFGDGWQTNDGNGGNGIMVTLDGSTVIEVGMCNPYVAVPYTCEEGDGFNATTTVTIPEGVENAVWFFPGDTYGEIFFEIYGPDGNLVFASGNAGDLAAGTINFVLCAE